ncbi:hypothetical protein JF544_06020 [Halobacillus kuroshimensis]|uniref:Uncharacterized protein n=1 Tax=Halobacillus kuroshimensis TaxID=302481 RepID=A0ABS3DTX2_9BACI|nr:hypothetical protein [Halobacillus kuroshimensis]MBN8234795.1 hypothetical protein [Halobacillus kuroshimensis]
MEKALDEESLDQISIRMKSRKAMWYNFLVMAFLVGVSQLFFESVTGIIYLAAMLFFGLFLYETLMVRKTNEQLWQIWEERWLERPFLYSLRSSFSQSAQVWLPAIITTDFSWVMAAVLSVFSLGVGFYSGFQRWRAKNYYYRIAAGKGQPAVS